MNLSNLFFQMLRIRRIEEAISERYLDQKMRCPTHLSIGQEGVAVGVMSALSPEDFIISGHRSHAHYLAKGGDLKKMIAELHGKVTGCSAGRGGSMHLADVSIGMMGSTPITGNTISVGVGLALASSLKKEKQITAIFFGEGATEEGTFCESLNFASLKNLPVLFVCENNQYSAHMPSKQRQARSRVQIAAAHSIFAKEGDGNAMDECASLAEEAIAHIQNGNGPAFIELSTYRFSEHCGPKKESLESRPQEELERYLSRCPVKLARDTLLRENIESEESIDAMESKIQKEINEAFTFALESPLPKFDLDYELMYAE